MNVIAIDIVLLPEADVARRCVTLNARLVAEFASEIRLHEGECLPHCSLAMGCLDQTALPDVACHLERILNETPQEAFRVSGIHGQDLGQGRLVSSVDLLATPPLQTLHERIMGEVAPLLSRDARPDMLHGDGPISPSTLDWISHYPDNSSFARFSPHITLGYGRVTDPTFPQLFRARSLAVCHLGNHCTCRKTLWEIAL